MNIVLYISGTFINVKKKANLDSNKIIPFVNNAYSLYSVNVKYIFKINL